MNFLLMLRFNLTAIRDTFISIHYDDSKIPSHSYENKTFALRIKPTHPLQRLWKKREKIHRKPISEKMFHLSWCEYNDKSKKAISIYCYLGCSEMFGSVIILVVFLFFFCKHETATAAINDVRHLFENFTFWKKF